MAFATVFSNYRINVKFENISNLKITISDEEIKNYVRKVVFY